jgi:cytochrome b
MAEESAPDTIKLWDLPVRLAHWSFAILLPALWWTWKSGRMDVHQLLGHVALALLVFRIFWGFVGSSTARFGQFVKGPRAVLDYVRGLRGDKRELVIGHNPLGGWSVILMLGLLLLQVGLGLIAQDTDGLVSGPLSHYVSYETSDAARKWHQIVFYFVLALVAVHIAAVLSYLIFKRENLVPPMITGRKPLALPVNPPVPVPAWRAAVGALLGAAFSYWVWLGCPL